MTPLSLTKQARGIQLREALVRSEEPVDDKLLVLIYRRQWEHKALYTQDPDFSMRIKVVGLDPRGLAYLALQVCGV